MDINQIHAVVQNFDDHFPELFPVVVQASNDYEKQFKKAVTHHLRNILKENRIDEGTDILKKGINKQVELKV